MKVLIYMSGGFDTHGPSNHLFNSLIVDMLEKNIEVNLIQSKTTKDGYIPKKLKSYPNFHSTCIRISKPKKNQFIQRYISLVMYAFRTRKVLKRNRDVDVVFVQSCATAPFQVTFAKKLTKKKVIYNVQDMFPDSSIATGALKNRFLVKFFTEFHKKAYKNADHIVVISEDMKEKMLKHGVDEQKITTINNWYDDQVVQEIKSKNNIFIKKYNIDESNFIIQYAGGMGYVFEYEQIIRVAKELENNEDIVFHMIGNGSRLEDFKKDVIKNELNNIKFFPMQPQDDVADVYSSASICLIPLKKGIIGNSVPSKIALIMACNRIPISIVDKSNYYEIFNSNRIGYAYTHDEVSLIAKQILVLKNNKELYKEIAFNGQQFAKKYYSRKNNTKKYIDIMYEMRSN